jgi:iron(III) transport system substrate-binding protein
VPKFNCASIVYLLLFLSLSACTASPALSPAAVGADQLSPAKNTDLPIQGKLVLYSGRSEPLIQPVIEAFKMEYPQIEILLKAGSNSELANALIEEKANPQADLFITTELITVQTLSQQGVFQAYLPQGVENWPAGFFDPEHKWIGLTRRARVIMVNTDLVPSEEWPTSIFELDDPQWKGQIAAAGSTNGSMQAQIAAIRQLLGEAATQEWLEGLLVNEVTFFGGHTDVRKAVGAGEF